MIEVGRVNIDQGDVEYTNNQTKLKINGGNFQSGSLQLTKNEIAWTKENTEEGFTIPWGKIVVTAISQDPQRCIYFMIDSKMFDDEPANGNGNGNNHEENEEDDDEGVEAESEHEMTEFWLIPEVSNDVDNIYFFMSKYPAAPIDDSEDEEEEEFFDGEEMEHMNINDDDPRFAD